MREFGEALSAADEVVLTDIYAAGEPPIPGVTIDALAAAIRATARGAVRVVAGARGCARRGCAHGAARRPRDHAWRRLDRRHWRADSRSDSSPAHRIDGRQGGQVKVKAPAEKNFRRARAKPARRRRWRALVQLARRTRVCSSLPCSSLAGYRAFDLVYNSSLFRVNRVRVHGNVRISSGEVQALVRDLQGAHILTADLAESRDRLLESPWLAEVALRRVLPSTIDVYVSERRPFGLCRHGNQLYLVARDGTVIDEFGPQYAEFEACRSSTASSPASRRRACRVRRGPCRRPCRKPIRRGRRWRRASWTRFRATASSAAACRRSTSPTRTTPWSSSTTIRRCCTSARSGSGSGCSRTWRSPKRFASAFPDIDYVDLRFEQRLLREAARQGRRHVAAVANGWQDFLRGRRGTQGTLPRGSGCGHVEGHGHRRRSDRRWRPGHHRDGAGRLARHQARRRRQPRSGGRLDQEGDRRSRADRRRRDRLGPSRPVGRARQGVQQPRRRRGGRQEPRDHARGRPPRDRRRKSCRVAERT